MLELIFGVALGAYFGHTSAGHAAKVVLNRDPGGRQFLAGNVAAMLSAMVIYVLFVLGVTGAVGADALAGFDGTALTPLGERVGPVIDVMGTIYVVLTMGLIDVHRPGPVQPDQRPPGTAPAGPAGVFGEPAGSPSLLRAPRPRSRSSCSWRSFSRSARSPSRRSRARWRRSRFRSWWRLPDAPARRGAAAWRTGPWPGPGGPWPSRRRRIVAVVFLLGVAVFGLWIWTDPLERFAAIAVTVAIVVLAAVSVRRGAFRPRTVVEYRVEATPPAVGVVSVVSGGRAIAAQVRVHDSSGDRRAPSGSLLDEPQRVVRLVVDLPSDVAPELLLWVHTVTSDGSSTSTGGAVDVAIGDAPPSRVAGTLDHLQVPSSDGPTTLTLSMSTGPGAQ